MQSQNGFSTCKLSLHEKPTLFRENGKKHQFVFTFIIYDREVEKQDDNKTQNQNPPLCRTLFWPLMVLYYGFNSAFFWPLKVLNFFLREFCSLASGNSLSGLCKSFILALTVPYSVLIYLFCLASDHSLFWPLPVIYSCL